MSNELINEKTASCPECRKPIVVDSLILESIIDALIDSQTREVSFAIRGGASITLMVEKITLGGVA